MQAVIKSLGDLLDSLGGYLALRFLIPDRDTVRRAIMALAAVCVIQGASMVSEQFTHQNVFGFLGSYPPEVKRRPHSFAGSSGRSLRGPVGRWSKSLIYLAVDRRKIQDRCVRGTCRCNGHGIRDLREHVRVDGSYGASLVGLGFWPLRQRMRLVRWGLVGLLVGLHLVMHGPVWSLIEKVDVTGGSSSYHRYMLVDNCIRHFGDWWLLGYKNYGDWGFVMFDVCNQFVLAALRGGLVTLVVYIAIYKRSFGAIGSARKRVAADRGQGMVPVVSWFRPVCHGGFVFWH